MNYSIILIAFLFTIISSSFAQEKTYSFDCNGDFYQLMGNQLHALSVDKMGNYLWQPILPPFQQPLGALGYCLEDGFMYSIDTASRELLRIYSSGSMHSLGIPRDAATQEKLNTLLTIGTVVKGVFCAYAPLEKKLYWIDIKTNTYTVTAITIKGGLYNLAYHAAKGILYTVANDSKIYSINPTTKSIVAIKKIQNFSVPTSTGGNFWITGDDRLFLTSNKGAKLYELNEKTGISYVASATLSPKTGDGTNCPDAFAALIEDDVLELKVEKPNSGRVMIRWIGVHEAKNERYIVEHSTDNKLWNSCDAKPSSGAQLHQNPYGSMSRYAASKSNYYRLKKIRQNGEGVYTKTLIASEIEGESHVLLSPQYVVKNEQLFLFLNGYQDNIVTVELINSYGQIMKEEVYTIFSNEQTIHWSTEGLLEGSYCARIKTNRGVKYCWFWVQKNG